MTNQQKTTHEYKNDFLSIVILPDQDRKPGTFLCCFSISLSRFRPISQGHFGICSNPAFKGLQLLRADVSAFAIKHDVTPRSSNGPACTGTSPRVDGWYHEDLMIDNAPETFLPELLEFSVRDLLEKVLSVCAPDCAVPDDVSDPAEVQRYLESLSKGAAV